MTTMNYRCGEGGGVGIYGLIVVKRYIKNI